jgi:hypothetical protein
METKICSKCNIEKKITEYKIIKRRGKKCYHAKCLICYKEYYNERNKKSYNKNKEKFNQLQKEYRENNKEKISKQRKQYRENNKEKLIQEQKIKYKKNKEYYINKVKEYYSKNKNEIIKKKNIRYNERMKTDLIFKLKKNIKSLISSKIKNKGYMKNSRTHEILGCSFEQFKLHLENLWESWMNWDNYGLYNGTPNYGWDIDHIIPTSLALTEDDIINLNHYTNLQPLCSYVNRVIKKDNC